jgi:hypothetical protein
MYMLKAAKSGRLQPDPWAIELLAFKLEHYRPNDFPASWSLFDIFKYRYWCGTVGSPGAQAEQRAVAYFGCVHSAGAKGVGVVFGANAPKRMYHIAWRHCVARFCGGEQQHEIDTHLAEDLAALQAPAQS